MGHVGLELTATDGTKISAVRRMKLTQKATAKKATFQSLEGTMRVNKNGKKVDMSSKCLDMKVRRNNLVMGNYFRSDPAGRSVCVSTQ